MFFFDRWKLVVKEGFIEWVSEGLFLEFLGMCMGIKLLGWIFVMVVLFNFKKGLIFEKIFVVRLIFCFLSLGLNGCVWKGEFGVLLVVI